MSTAANQSELIIALSNDKVRINLSGQPDSGRSQWKTSFNIPCLFLDDQIALSFDQVLFENPALIEEFPCVEIVILDRPYINIPRHYADKGLLPEIASRHLRLRKGDTLATDISVPDTIFCYSMPTSTLQVLKEYYANIRLTHFSSILWQILTARQEFISKKTSILFFTLIHNNLIVLASDNGKLVFSKNITIKKEADFFYFTLAISRLLKSDEHWLISIQDEESLFEISDESILKIDHRLILPNLHDLLAQYKACAS